MELYQIYRPITAAPFRNCESYMEFEPCDALKPYVRCFWGTRRTVKQENSGMVEKQVVTPDTCMDIIFMADLTNNKMESTFHGIDDRTFAVHNISNMDRTFFEFAIRFYAWGAAAFAKESMRDTKNAFFDVGYHFAEIKKEIERQLFDVTDIYQMISVAEKVLIKCLSGKQKNQAVLQAVHKILAYKGNLSMTDLKHETLIGDRQLERLFSEYVGVSPKSLASMVRYQYLWSDLLCQNFNAMDAVYKYGYSDQAHLCHDFKKYHSMSMMEARKYALQNVGNVQDTYSQL